MLFVVSLARRLGFIKACDVQIDGKPQRIDVECLNVVVAPVRYRGPHSSCPNVWLQSMQAMDEEVVDGLEQELNAVDATPDVKWSRRAAPTIMQGAESMDLDSLFRGL